MNGFDWNNNGKRDSFDAFMDMEIMNETGKSSSEKNSSNGASTKKTVYNASKDSDGAVILKCIVVTAICVGAMLLPLFIEAGSLFFGIIMLAAAFFGAAILSNKKCLGSNPPRHYIIYFAPPRSRFRKSRLLQKWRF